MKSTSDEACKKAGASIEGLMFTFID